MADQRRKRLPGMHIGPDFMPPDVRAEYDRLVAEGRVQPWTEDDDKRTIRSKEVRWQRLLTEMINAWTGTHNG